MLKNYLTLAFKVLMRRKFFTFVSLFGISFTLMILVVATSFLDDSFAPHYPETKFDRALWMQVYRMRSPDHNSNWNGETSYYVLDRYIRPLVQKSEGALESVSIFSSTHQVTTYLNGNKIEFILVRTDGDFWKILEFDFLEGNAFTSDDDKNRNFVVVINQTMREKFFKGESAVGKTILFDGNNYKVVGVVKNVSETRQVAYSDIWAPISTQKNQNYRNMPKSGEDMMGDFRSVLLTRSRNDFEAVQSQVAAAFKTVEFPDPKEFNTMESLPQTYFGQAASDLFFDWENRYSKDQSPKLLLAIFLAALFFMLMPTINLVNLNISRMMERASEIGMRKSFGASSNVLIGQFLVENLCLTIIGGFIGLLLSVVVLNLINQSGIWQYATFTLNLKVFFYGFLTMIFFGIFSGVYPAWRMSKLNPVQALKGVR